MDKDGFLPAHDCRRCGKPLHGQGTGYPAELYAGTYTSLCYPCTSERPYVVGTYSNGAVRVSHPPDCPSHRRDRRTYVAFVDCERCRGEGVQWFRSAALFAERTLGQCEPCWLRHNAPQRDWDIGWTKLRLRADACEAEARKLYKNKALRKADAWEPLWVSHWAAVDYRAVLREVWAYPRRPADPAYRPLDSLGA